MQDKDNDKSNGKDDEIINFDNAGETVEKVAMGAEIASVIGLILGFLWELLCDLARYAAALASVVTNGCGVCL